MEKKSVNMDEDMGEIDDSDLIEGLNINYLKYFGIWKIINHFRIYQEKHIWLKIGVFITMAVIFPYTVISMSSVIFLKVDLQEASLFILNPLSGLQSMLKVAVFWYGIKNQCKIMSMMKKDFLKCVPKKRMAEAKEIMRKIAVKSNQFCRAGASANATCVIVWNFLPILTSEYFKQNLHIKLETIERKMPNKILGGWYPFFNYTETPYSEMVYVYEFAVCSWAGIVITLHECILIQLIMMLNGHINVIAHVLSTLRRSDFENENLSISLSNDCLKESKYYKEHIDDKMYKQMMKCLKDHIKIVGVGKQIKTLYNFLITMQLGTGLIIMIISVFHFMYYGTKDALVTFKFMAYLSYVMVENVLYCYSGAFLEESSQSVVFAAYGSEWYTCDKKYRNALQLIMVRAYRPISLIAVQLYPVNLETLSNLLQLTYSTSALMRRFVND